MFFPPCFLCQLALGLLRFGFVAIYLTEPLVRGFTTAAAIHVCVSQLKYLLGVRTRRFSGPLSLIYVSSEIEKKPKMPPVVHATTPPPRSVLVWSQSVVAVVGDITSTNAVTLVLGLACLVFLYAIKDLNERYKANLPIPIPGEIIVVMVSTGVSYGLSLSSDYNVDVVGTISTG